MAIAKISIVPVGTGSPSLSEHIARAVKVLRQEKGVKYELTSMGTIIEGDLDGILGVIKKMHRAVLAEGVTRVVTAIEIDDRQDKTSTMVSKVESVVKKLRS
ncbi:MAG: MTH1187 family thiamine-binding protein [Chloroflexi bacterium]|nr:MTH1187 family thiamine-binding protein [Chloroflexota bacterium]